jgi:5-methylcytosine-specific restriction endonuclease McrA
MYHRNKPENIEATNAAKEQRRREVLAMQKERGLDLPLTRKEAKATGAEFYFNGKPCPKGHITKRRTKSPGREECILVVGRENMRKARENKPEVIKDRKRAEYHRNAEANKPKRAAAYEANREKLLAEKKAYAKANPHIFRINGSLRRARKNNATPPWLVGDLLEEVKAIYTEASKLTCSQGNRIHVDHIVPLKGDSVSGLHVPWNMRLATKRENCQKNKKFNDPFTALAMPIPLGCGAALGSYQLL